MNNLLVRVLRIMLCGTITAILLFSVALLLSIFTPYSDGANLFALSGLRTIVLFCYIAAADMLAKRILKRREE